jgi:leucyl aminopeptidase (aminopeptidase T)
VSFFAVSSIAALLLLCLACLSASTADPKPGPMKDSPTAALARNIVRQAARVREGDLVHISGTPSDVEMVEELAVQARVLGAQPLITLTSDRLRRRLFDDVPAKFDSQPRRFDLALAGLADVLINMEATDESALLGVPPARMTAFQKTGEPVNKKLRERGVRTVGLGNGLYPAPTRAKRFGLSVAELRKLYEDGLAADGAKMQSVGAKIQKTLSAGKLLRVSSPAGTDLTMRIERRPVHVSDGILTPEKEKKGGAACMTWLPAGEVYVTPVPGTAEGKVVAPVVFWEGQEIRKLVLTFSAGKLTAMTAESGLERLQAVYKAHGPGKEQLGAIDIGINPGVRLPEGSKALNYVAAGIVTVALGNNTWAGGDVDVFFGLNCHLGGCTVKVDDTVVVESGKLMR